MMQSNGPLLAAARDRGEVSDLPRVLDLEIDPPVEWDSRTYDHLHLEEPTTRMVQRAESVLTTAEANVAQLRAYQIALVSHAANVPRQVVEMMRISQTVEAFNFLLQFVNPGRSTGEN